MVDIDIYGDLCADLPAPSPATLTSPAPLQSPAPSIQEEALPFTEAAPHSRAPPRFSPPPGPPPGLPVFSPAPDRSPDSPLIQEVDSSGPQTWVAPGYEHLAPSAGRVTSFIIEGGEIVAGSAAAAAGLAGAAEVEEEETLESELLAVASTADRSNVRPRRKNASDASAPEAAPGRGPLQPLLGADSASVCSQFLLVGGLPLTLLEAELRRLAQQFGQLNAVRGLDDAVSGKSAGIALLEYKTAESASRAAGAGDGICASTAWPIMTAAPPKLVLVGRELLNILRAASPPWTEGGPCSDDLRCVLLRQFEQWGLYRRSGDISPPRQLARQGSGSLQLARSGRRGDSPEAQAPRREEGWANKLQALKRKVNSKQDLGDAKRERV